MIPQGKCPKCDQTVSRVTLEAVPIDFNFQERWQGVSYLCPKCKTVLSVGIDPVVLGTEIVKDILKALGKKQ